ncbi:MAG: outer membrane beta-barrel protein [Verrucomicrobiota bacterium]
MQRPFSAICAICGYLSLAGLGARAQDVLMPREDYSLTPPAVTQASTNQMEVFTPPPAASPREAAPVNWGPVSLRPRLFYRFIYGNGIPAGGDYVKTAINEVSPGILMSIGSHWVLDYAPTWMLYTSSQLKNTVGQNASLTGGAVYGDWMLEFSQSYVFSSDPQIQTGTQTDESVYLTLLRATYHFNSRLTTDLAVDQKVVVADQFQSYKEWATLDWLNYDFYTRMQASIGLGGGYDAVQTGADMSFEQMQARFQWRATDKLSIRVNGGGEVRQYLQSDLNDTVSPVGGGQIQYMPVDGTRITLSADHIVNVSLLVVTNGGAGQSQLVESTDFAVGVQQRLLEHFTGNLGVGYHIVDYTTAGSTVSDRRDHYFDVDARVGTQFRRRGNFAIFYRYTNNNSTDSGFTFNSNQGGMQLEWRY